MRPHIQQLANDLKARGIRYAFGVTGGGASLELITHLMSEGIEYIPVSHEAAAPIMAGATAVDGTLRAVAISIKGPGFINMMPGITLNHFEQRPSLSISEAYDLQQNISKVHKKIDQKAIVSPVTKAYDILGDHTGLQALVQCAQAGVPGPVHLDISNDRVTGLQKSNQDDDGLDAENKSYTERIKTHKKIAIILGSVARSLTGVDWSSIGVPVCTTAAAKGVIDETGDFVGGVITGEVKDLSPESTILSQADCIVAVGLRQSEVVKPMSFNKPTFIIDTVMGCHEGFGADEFLVHDLEQAARNIKEVVTESWGEEVCNQVRKTIEEELLGDVWLPGHVFETLNEGLSEATLVLDTGLFCTIGETIFKAAKPEYFIGSSQGRFMGVAIPTAIGHAIHAANKTICVIGDGGVMPYVSEIAIAVDQNLPIMFVMMSDGGYGAIGMGAEEIGAPKEIYEHKKRDVAGIVGAMGCKTSTAENLTDFQNIVGSWAGISPIFITCTFDKEQYRSMTKNIR